MDRETSWTSGYVTELEYTYGYYRELSPGLLRLACVSAGVAPPSAKPLRYLELGFGQGLSINIHAAAVDGDFWGTDFNPTQVTHARALAEASGSGAKLFEDSFAELAARPDLPEFDIIGLHGIWTWISDENSRQIVDLIRRKLRAGGIVYISYNCLPGWAPAMPLRHLMKLHADFAGEASGLLAKLDGAVSFAQQVIDSGALFFRGNPAVAERLKRMSALDRHYLAHEFFTQDWRVMPFSEMAGRLDDAKLNFVASAYLLDHVEAVNLTEAGQKLLSSISHPVLRQSVRDYFVNQQFRRDIFAKGYRRLTQLEQNEAFRQQAFVLLVNADEVPMKVTGSLGEANLQEEVYRPVIQALADDSYAPKTVTQLATNPRTQWHFGTAAPSSAACAHRGRIRAPGARSIEANKSHLCSDEPLYLRAKSKQHRNFLPSISCERVGYPRFRVSTALPVGGATGQASAQRTGDVCLGSTSRARSLCG